MHFIMASYIGHSLLFKDLLSLDCVCACVGMCVHANQVPAEVREGCEMLRGAVKGNCELLNMGAGIQALVLCKNTLCTLTEPSLQPPVIYFYCGYCSFRNPCEMFVQKLYCLILNETVYYFCHILLTRSESVGLWSGSPILSQSAGEKPGKQNTHTPRKPAKPASAVM